MRRLTSDVWQKDFRKKQLGAPDALRTKNKQINIKQIKKKQAPLMLCALLFLGTQIHKVRVCVCVRERERERERETVRLSY